MSLKRYSSQFWLLCLSTYLFFVSFNMIIPQMNAFITMLGGADKKGFIIGLFTVAAFISRPFSGKLTDTIGRKPIIYAGTMVCLILGGLYPFVHTVAAFLTLRFFHGFSTGFQPTGTTAYLADTIPAERRGEAVGYLGVAGTLGMGSGPYFGGLISEAYGLDWMFYASSLAALLSVLLLTGLRETLTTPVKFKWSMLAVWREPMIDRNVLPAAIVLTMASYCFGLFITIIPDLSVHLGVPNPGTIFLFYTISSLFTRVVAGKASDKFGRVPMIVVAMVFLIVGMLILAFATNQLMFFAGGIVLGLGTGINTPSVFAWTIDLGNDKARAKGVATTFMGLEAGIFAGSVLSFYLYLNKPENFLLTFVSGAFMAFLVIIYLFFYLRRVRVS